MAIYTHEDLDGTVAEPLPLLIPHPTLTNGRTPATPGAATQVNHVGEAVVMVVADDRYVAEDACERIRVDYELLPPSWASSRPAPPTHLVHEDVPGNVAAHMEQEVGDAARRHRRRPAHADPRPRRSSAAPASPMEGQGVVRPLGQRRRSRCCSSPPPRPRPVCGRPSRPSSGSTWPGRRDHPRRGRRLRRQDHPPVARGGARAAGRPSARTATIKWVEDRREHFISSAHERGQVHHVEVGFDDEGRVLGPRRPVLARQRRLHAVRPHRPDHHLHPAARALQARRLPVRVLLAVHQHRDRDALPRRRAPAGLLRDGAHDGRDRRLPRQRPRRGAQRQLHPARRVPLRPRADLPGRPRADLRLRRLPGLAWTSSRSSSAGTSSRRSAPRRRARAGGSASASPATSRAPASAPTRAPTCTSRPPARSRSPPA